MNRPLPQATAESRPFWDGCAAGELRFQRCRHCGKSQFIPRTLCEKCQHADLEWHVASGLGRILSFTVVYRAPTPAFREDLPYVIALVDLDEGFRQMVNMDHDLATPLAIGQPVRIGFRQVDGVALPHAHALTGATA
jgi:uncharacterized OB-fold protein